MKKILLVLAIPAILAFISSACKESEQEKILKAYDDWRQTNDEWVQQQIQRKNPDGTPYYRTITPSWNPSGYILMHQFNDPAETAGNLVPLYTSTVDVRYIGRTCEDVPFDSSTMLTEYGKAGIARFQCNSVVPGWSVALENMHVGDTVEIIVPYQMGYGAQASGVLPPYTSMRFNMRLADIYLYEAKP